MSYGSGKSIKIKICIFF
jgi:hypothetical protein